MRFTSEASNYNSLWSHDGSRILFTSGSLGRFGLYQKSSTGTGQAELLMEAAGNQFASDWTVDGRFVVFDWVKDRTRTDIWILPLTGDRKPFPFLETSFEESRAHFSPDGRWLAYQSNLTGVTEVYVRPFNPPGEPARAGWWHISNNGGMLARWRQDGKELFYREVGSRKLMAVAIHTTPSGQLQPGTPKSLFEAAITGQGGDYYDVTPDGRRFLIVTPLEDPVQSNITIVLNWMAGLKR